MAKMDSASKLYMGDPASCTHAMGGAVEQDSNGCGGSSSGASKGGSICDDQPQICGIENCHVKLV
jgi:hypothetical protein